jgi:transposase-like protein
MTTTCPECCSKAFKRNGFTRHGKQNHRCLDCGRQFSVEPALEFVLDLNAKFAAKHAIKLPSHVEVVGASAPLNG